MKRFPDGKASKTTLVVWAMAVIGVLGMVGLSGEGGGPVLSHQHFGVLAAAGNSTSGNTSAGPGGINPCSGLGGGVDVTVTLPAISGGHYVAEVDYGGSLITSNSSFCVVGDNQDPISAVGYHDGYSFTGWSATGGTLSNHLALSTDVDFTTGTGYGSLQLSAQPVSNPELVEALIYPGSPTGAGVANAIINGYYFENSQTTYLTSGHVYSISAANYGSGYAFSQWTSSAGTLGNLTTQSTTLTVGSSGGVLRLVAAWSPTNWAAYVAGKAYDSVSGTVYLPARASGAVCPPPGDCGVTIQDIAFWVGLGGASASALLWQAGVAITFTSGVMSISPFIEAVGSGCLNTKYGCDPYYGSISISLGNHILETVSTSGGTSSWFIEDLNNSQTWQGSESWSPSTATAEWVGESPTAADGSGTASFSSALFVSLKLNGTPVALDSVPLQASLIAFSNDASYISPGYVDPTSGWDTFYITDSAVRSWPS
jgi:Divergent InlB B-repeat domain